MKRYVKSFKTVEDKRDNRCPYKYVLKHGIGPGTLPKDVTIGKVEDGDYYDIVYLDRPLTKEELKFYDIPAEWEIDRYVKSYKGIDRIKDDEVYADEDDPYYGYRWYYCDNCGYQSFHRMEEDDGMCPSCYDHHGAYGEVDPIQDPSWYEDIDPEYYKHGYSIGGRPEYDRDIFNL